jgi:hypothetical protein
LKYLPLKAVENGCFGCLDGLARKMNAILTINGATSRFWMQHNHPIELSTREMTIQRLNYMHQNPVEMVLLKKRKNGCIVVVAIITETEKDVLSWFSSNKCL